jgi:integrase
MASLRGHLTSEVSFVFKEMIAFGEKKGKLKAQALAEKKVFSHYYRGKIFSHSTFENYYEEAKQFVHWCHEHYKLRSVYRVKSEMFAAYIKDGSANLSANTLKTRIAAITKLVEGVELVTGKEKLKSFKDVAYQLYAELPKSSPVRPVYSAQQIQSLAKELSQTNSHYSLVFEIHVETGCRLRELSQLSRRDLVGLVEGQKVGLLAIRGKGGRIRELKVSQDTYVRLVSVLDRREILCNYHGYRQALRRASESLGFTVVATHAVRRFVAQRVMSNSVAAYRGLGLDIKEATVKALGDVNQMLGHSRERVSTTRLYLNA